jgi:hypothetical protein
MNNLFTKRTDQCLHGNKTLENMACIMVPITKKQSLDFKELLMHVNDNSFMMASRELVPKLVTPKSHVVLSSYLPWFNNLYY